MPYIRTFRLLMSDEVLEKKDLSKPGTLLNKAIPANALQQAEPSLSYFREATNSKSRLWSGTWLMR